MNKLFPQKYGRMPGYIELPLPATTQKHATVLSWIVGNFYEFFRHFIEIPGKDICSFKK